MEHFVVVYIVVCTNNYSKDMLD